MSYYNSNLNSSYCRHNCSFDFDRSNLDIKYTCQRTIMTLEQELSAKDREIAELRLQLEDKERINRQMYLDLENRESDLLAAEQEYRRNENDMLADISLLEIDNKDLLRKIEERPGFTFYTDQINSLKNELSRKDYLLNMLQQSYNRIQNLLGGSANFKLIQNLDIADLKVKLYEVEETIENQNKRVRSETASQTKEFDSNKSVSLSGSQKRDYLGSSNFSSYKNDFIR
jgi:hypothetical protein